MTDREKVMQDMERVAFPIYKPNGKDIMVLGSLYEAGYRKEEEVQKETLTKLIKNLKSHFYGFDIPLWIDILKSIIENEFGVEVEE